MYSKFHYGLALIGKILGIDPTPLTRKWCDIYESRSQNRGKADAVKFVKELNTVCERYALRQNITPIPWTKSYNDGFPKCLGPDFRRELRSSDTKRVIMALSVMRSCEVLRLPVSKDTSTITDPSGADIDLMNDIISFIPTWLKRIKPLKLRAMKYHFTVKNGPNGHALHSSDKDISAVINDPEIFESLQIVQEKLKDNRPMEYKPILKRELTGIHSKLTQFPEKAGKTRTIAIIDYYSQRCLKPLHQGIMEILASLVSDGTYSHQNVGRFAQQKTKEKSFIYCADLTAFTDRFPGEIQRVLLDELVKDDELSQALWTLLAKRTFKLAWSDETVTYNCGQPMGAYGSWPLCSLAHHLVVEYSAFLAGYNSSKSFYRLIGDDVIITEKSIAESYERVITSLGVEINLSKTVSSPQYSNNPSAEVAKQLYLSGQCLTPLTPGFMRDLKKPYMFNTCMGVLSDRYEWYQPETPSMLLDLFFTQKNRRKVWLLCSNPISGIIKPGMPGYDDCSPWISKDLEEARINYPKMVVNNLLDKAMNFVDQFLEMQFSGGSPWKDTAQPPPRCLGHIKRDIDKDLTKAMDRLGELALGESPETLVAEFDFIPDPFVPYQERKEMRQKRMASTIESLYDYEDYSVGVQLDW